MERSDETRRRFRSLYDRLSQVHEQNRNQAEKIIELERIIVEAKECVKLIQKESDLRHQLFHKAIQPVAHWYNRDTILDTVIDIVADLQKDRAAVLKQAEYNDEAKGQITALGKEIDQLHSHNKKALEHIWNNLKLVKIHFC